MPYRLTHKMAHRKSAHRATFLRAALTLFSERGYHATSVRNIIAAAHSSNGSFYFYFRNKEDLFVRALESSAKAMARALQRQVSAPRPCPFQQFRHAVETLVLLLVMNPAITFILILQSSSGLGAPLEKLRRDVVTNHARFFEQLLAKLAPPPSDCALAARWCIGSVYECVRHWLELPPDQRTAPKTLAAAIADFTLHGVATPQPVSPEIAVLGGSRS